MNPMTITKWLPRLAGGAFAAFLAMFALDAGCAVELLMHLIPTLVVIVGILVSWQRPRLGAAVFAGMALAATGYFHTYRSVDALLLITGPFLLTAALFALHWRMTRNHE